MINHQHFEMNLWFKSHSNIYSHWENGDTYLQHLLFGLRTDGTPSTAGLGEASHRPVAQHPAPSEEHDPRSQAWQSSEQGSYSAASEAGAGLLCGFGNR